ncbi:hypothetical protein E1A91_A12G040600v1, partial [Gossypium mustelinum]
KKTFHFFYSENLRRFFSMSFGLKIYGVSSPCLSGLKSKALLLHCTPNRTWDVSFQTEMQHRSEEPTWMPRFYPLHLVLPASTYRSKGFLIKSRIKII